MFENIAEEDKNRLTIVKGEVQEIGGLRVVQDYDEIKEALLKGEAVMHWEMGFSMHPMLMNGEYCRIEPINGNYDAVRVGDAVCCGFKSGPREFLMVHRCTDIVERNSGRKYFKISTTDGTDYGWTPFVYGIAHSTDHVNSAAFAFTQSDLT